MRYPWTFLAILGIWVSIAVLLAKEPRLDAVMLYIIGVASTIALAVIGFKSAA